MKRTTLKPDKTKTVTFIVPGEKLSYYGEKSHRFIVEPGIFEVMAGSSSSLVKTIEKNV